MPRARGFPIVILSHTRDVRIKYLLLPFTCRLVVVDCVLGFLCASVKVCVCLASPGAS